MADGLRDLLAAVGTPEGALVHEGTAVTFTRADVEASVEWLAGALTSAGVGPGHAVAVSLPNGVGIVAALFAVWRIGAVYVPVNPRLTEAELAHVMEEVHPVVAVTTSDDARRFTVPLISPDAEDPGRWWPSRTPSAGGPTHDPDVALISFTSGTTGRPKPVLMRHSGVLELLDGVIGSLRTKPGPARDPMPNLVPVSMSLWAGIYQVLFAFRVGAPVVVLPRFTTSGFAEAVRHFAIRSTVLPPAAMAMLSDDEAITDLAPLRYVRSISAPLSPLQARRFRDRFGIAVLNGWGQTEIGGEIVGWSGEDSKAFGETKLGAVGRPHRGVTVRAVDADGHDLPVDEPGELWVQTPSLSAGYADGADLSDRMSPDGWFRTGDVGRVDADGFVWIEGRVSDMINRGGLKVFPAEVAEVLLLAPGIADAHVVGAPDDRLGEVPWAFLVPADGEQVPADDELAALCREHLAPYKVPVGFVTLAALPRNEIGKVLANDLLALVPD
jgi:acyl-CoA synthetase (AMP-forming)/AMP-acid ligase II